MSKKKCSHCLRTLPADMFEKGGNAKGKYYRTECRTCTQEKRTKAKNQTPYTYLKLLFTQLKSSRRNSEITWNLELDYIYKLWDEQKGCCALSGINMTWHRGGGQTDYSCSIDRKDSKKGYEVGNIQLVCSTVNYMKSTLNDAQLYWWCKNIVDYKERNI